MKRRQLITSGIDSKMLRIRHFELEKKEGDHWVIIANVNEETQTIIECLHRRAKVLIVNA